MEASKAAYGVEGEKSRKTSGDQFKGHKEEKLPDAMSRMLAFWLATQVENQKKALDTAVGALTEQHQDLAQRALQTVLNTGKQAENDRDMRAKMCSDVRYKDGQKSCIRWIVSVPAHPEFMQAMGALKQIKNLEGSAEQGRGRQSNDEQSSQINQGRSQGQRKRMWLLWPKETPKEVKSETSTARVRLCTKTALGA